MMRLGETIEVDYGIIKKFWLVKQPQLKKYTNKIYCIMGFIPGKGWMTCYNGTLAEARKWAKDNTNIEEEKENEEMEERTIKTLDEIAKAIDEMKTRGAWNTGVKAYAQMIIEEIAERADWEGRNPETFAELQDWALNGANDWTEASYGGGYLVYNYDIAHTLCNPTELKKTQEGAKEPNPSEDWCQVQARALYQAYRKIAEAARI